MHPLEACEVLSEQATMGKCHAQRVAGDRRRIGNGVTSSQAVSGDIEAFDGLQVSIENLEVVVGYHARYGNEAHMGGTHVVSGPTEEGGVGRWQSDDWHP